MKQMLPKKRHILSSDCFSFHLVSSPHRINTINMLLYVRYALHKTLYIIIIQWLCSFARTCSSNIANAIRSLYFFLHFIIMIITIMVCVATKNAMCCFKFLALIYSVAYRSNDCHCWQYHGSAKVRTNRMQVNGISFLCFDWSARFALIFLVLSIFMASPMRKYCHNTIIVNMQRK